MKHVCNSRSKPGANIAPEIQGAVSAATEETNKKPAKEGRSLINERRGLTGGLKRNHTPPGKWVPECVLCHFAWNLGG